MSSEVSSQNILLTPVFIKVHTVVFRNFKTFQVSFQEGFFQGKIACYIRHPFHSFCESFLNLTLSKYLILSNQ